MKRAHSASENTYGIIGLGLLGGSIARGLRKREPNCRILAVESSSKVRQVVRRAGLIDQCHRRSGPYLAESQGIVVCVPFAELPSVFADLSRWVDPSTWITDVTGIKTPVFATAAKFSLERQFVGSHPMAGGTSAGFFSSRPDLFAGQIVVVCPGTAAKSPLHDVSRFWRKLGARVLRMNSSEHDRQVAITSHLPYMLSLALGELVRRGQKDNNWSNRQIAAGRGLYYALRQAEFSPEIMLSVSRNNRYLPKQLRDLAKILRQSAQLLESDSPVPTRHVQRFTRLLSRTLADTN